MSSQIPLDRYRVLLLDMNSTFMFGEDRFGPDENFGATYRDAGGSALSDADVERAIRAAFAFLDVRYADPAYEDDFPSLAEAFDATSPELAPREHELLQATFARHERGVVPPECAAALKTLSATHELRVVSNIFAKRPLWDEELERAGVRSLFRQITFSSDSRSVKPSATLMHASLRDCPCELHEVLMIGDSVHRDAVAGRRIGAATAWLSTSTDLSGDADSAVDYQVASLPILAEERRPALYMIHRSRDAAQPPPPPVGYDIVAVPSEMLDSARHIVELDGPVSDAQWSQFTRDVLPDGLFVAIDRATDARVGTASVVHNPRGSRFYFPGGGEIGYVVVQDDHRGRGVGRALVDASVSRLRQAGYRNIWLGVHGSRLPAIRTYLAAGFVPFLHEPDAASLSLRWQLVFAALGRSIVPSDWPNVLSETRPVPASY